MKTTLKRLCVLGAMTMGGLCLTSCGKYNGPVPGLINGNTPQTFYSQMEYSKTTSGTSGASKYLAPADGTQRIVKTLQGGINLYEDPALFLTGPGSQYTLVSDLSVGCNNGHGLVKYRVDHKVVTGFWSVDGMGRINITPYAVGSGQMAGANSAVTLQFSRDLHSDVIATGAGSLTTQLVYRGMPTSIEDVANAGYQTDFQTAVSTLKTSGVCRSDDDAAQTVTPEQGNVAR